MPPSQQQRCCSPLRTILFPCALAALAWLVSNSVVPGVQAANTPERQYEVGGFIQVTDRSGNTSRFCDFWVAVAGPRSLIKVVFLNGESFACGTDGIDSYLLNEMLPATRRNGGGVSQFADISAGTFPTRALTPVQLVWLAFASGGSLREKGNELPLEGFQEAASFTRVQLSFSKLPPHLPESVKWWGPNFRFVGNQRERQPLPAYPQGYLAGAYSIAATTNFDGNALPLAWKMCFYLPDFQKGAARREEVTVSQTLTATVTNVSPLSYNGDFLPALGAQPVQFTEHRLEKRTGRAQQYPVINGAPLRQWPGRDNPYFQSLARSSSPLWQLWSSLTGPKYLWGLAVIGAAMVLAVILVVYWWSSGKETIP